MMIRSRTDPGHGVTHIMGSQAGGAARGHREDGLVVY